MKKKQIYRDIYNWFFYCDGKTVYYCNPEYGGFKVACTQRRDMWKGVELIKSSRLEFLLVTGMVFPDDL